MKKIMTVTADSRGRVALSQFGVEPHQELCIRTDDGAILLEGDQSQTRRILSAIQLRKAMRIASNGEVTENSDLTISLLAALGMWGGVDYLVDEAKLEKAYSALKPFVDNFLPEIALPNDTEGKNDQ